MDESRNSGRVRAILGAQIIFNNRNSTLDCQVRNISSKGARLSFSDTVSVPQEFELYVPQKGRTYMARLRWRDREGAGVEFFNEGAPAAAAPVEHSSDLLRKLTELEAENMALRLKVLELTRMVEKPSAERAA